MGTRSCLAFGLAAYICCGTPSPASATDRDRPLDQMLPEYSRCVASVMPGEARSFVLSPQAVESSASAKVKVPTARRCAYAFDGNMEVNFIASWYRDELAVQLVKAEFPDRGPTTFVDRDRLDHPKAPVKGSPRYIYQKLEFDNSRLGECVARFATEEVRSWIAASIDAAGDQPNDAVDAARRTCSGELGASFTGDHTRGAIARGYYRLAHGSTSSSRSGTGPGARSDGGTLDRP